MSTIAADPRRSGQGLLDAIEERIAPLSPARMGALVQGLREARGLALRDVALVPELRSELEDIEAGRLFPDASTVQALLVCFSASLDELVPPRDTLVVTEGSEHEVLTRYLAAVRRARGSDRNLVLRKADVEVLAGILGSDPREIQRRLRSHAVEERIAALSSARMGVLVHKLLQSTRHTRDRLARPPEALESQLGDIESGRIKPDVALVEALLSYCDAELDQLVPPRDTLVVTKGTDEEVLTRYLAAMRRWRKGEKHPPLRAADLEVLSGILGTDPTEIRKRLRKLTGCSRRRARRVSAMLLTGMAVTPAAVSLIHSVTAQPTVSIQTTGAHSNAQLLTATGSASAHTTATTAAHASADHTAKAAVAAAHTAAVHSVAADCATAMAYLSTHAKPGFAHYCRPGDLKVGIHNAVAYTCVPGPSFKCPDGHKEIIIADPSCAITYENEASNSYWNFSTGAVITPGAHQDGRTWDPFGECT